MKTKFYFAAIAAACAGLFFATGCNKDNSNDEPEAPSIKKQWVSETTDEQSGTVKQCFDICVSAENGILIGQYNEGYADMLPKGADPEKSYIAMAMGADEIVSIVADDATSGTIKYKQDMYGDGSMVIEGTLKYANLTETTVQITYTDIMSGEETVLECTVAPEGTKVYTYADLM